MIRRKPITNAGLRIWESREHGANNNNKAGTEARPTDYFKLCPRDSAPIDECIETKQANYQQKTH